MKQQTTLITKSKAYIEAFTNIVCHAGMLRVSDRRRKREREEERMSEREGDRERERESEGESENTCINYLQSLSISKGIN